MFPKFRRPRHFRVGSLSGGEAGDLASGRIGDMASGEVDDAGEYPARSFFAADGVTESIPEKRLGRGDWCSARSSAREAAVDLVGGLLP